MRTSVATSARFGEPRDFRLRELLVRDVRERVAAPQLQRLVEQLTRASRFALPHRFVPARGECVEAKRVDRGSVEGQYVSGTAPLDQVRRAERAPQRRYLSLQRIRAPIRCFVAPDRLDQRVVSNDLAAAKRQNGNQGLQACPRQRERFAVVVEHVERSQKTDLHRRNGTPRGVGGVEAPMNRRPTRCVHVATNTDRPREELCPPRPMHCTRGYSACPG